MRAQSRQVPYESPATQETDIEQQHHSTSANCAAHASDISIRGAVKEAVEAAEEATKQAVDEARDSIGLGRAMMRLEQDGGQRGRQCERIDRR